MKNVIYIDKITELPKSCEDCRFLGDDGSYGDKMGCAALLPFKIYKYWSDAELDKESYDIMYKNCPLRQGQIVEVKDEL